MPKIRGCVQRLTLQEGKYIAVIALDQKVAKIGSVVTIKWGSVRNGQQNRLYWAFLTWCIKEGRLGEEHGHFSPDGLHQDLKAYFLAEKIFTKGQFKSIESADDLTTTDLTKSEFSEYFQKVQDFMREFFKIDVAAFSEDKEIPYSGKTLDELG